MDAAKAVSYFRKVEEILGLLTLLNLTSYQWPKPVNVQDGVKFDFIVVGGGTAGCLIASRLIETGNFSVLLIEAGAIPPLESDMAGLFPYLKNTKYDWNFTSTHGLASTYHKNNVVHMSQGKMLGGSGSFNYACYARGYPHDYNKWALITNDSSWSWESLLPIFSKNEQLIDEKILEMPDPHYYGTKGKIKIQKKYYKRNLDYFSALKELGYNYHLDINSNHPLGFTNLMFNIGDDLRQSTALKFLSPLKKNPKLYVMLNTLATKIIFDNAKAAVGVEVLTEDNKILTLRAKKEIIVTAGTIKSPQLLMLSGIGPKDHLINKDIKVVADLPVGKNFQDHLSSNLVYKMTKSTLASNLGDPHKYPFVIFDGYIALNKSQNYPDYETTCIHFGDSLTFLGLCAFWYSFTDEFCNSLSESLENKEVFMVFVTHLNPKSRGEILLASTNPTDQPIIIPGYLTESTDLETQADYLIDFNRIVNTKFFKSMDAELVDPKLKSCAELERGTWEYWKCHAQGTADTSHCFVGTCAMGSVLDSRLRVNGVQRLRVADASVIPTNVHALPQASVIMIAQKASEMIIADWA